MQILGSGQSYAEAWNWPGEYERVILRMTSQELCVIHKISEEMTLNEIKSMEWKARYVFILPESSIPRGSRAVQGSSEN